MKAIQPRMTARVNAVSSHAVTAVPRQPPDLAARGSDSATETITITAVSSIVVRWCVMAQPKESTMVRQHQAPRCGPDRALIACVKAASDQTTRVIDIDS